MLFEGKDRRELEQLMKREGRLPPGQSLTLKWPVLHYGSVPRFDPQTWDFRVYGLVESPLKLSWDEFNALPKMQWTSDFHCVTRWSRFDNRWDGVAFQELLRRARPKPEAAYVLVHAEQGFTANVPLADLDREEVLLATQHDGQPLAPDHGVSSAPDRSSPLCLEIGQVGPRPGVPGPRLARFLGAERLSHVRRPVEGAEVHQGLMRKSGGRSRNAEVRTETFYFWLLTWLLTFSRLGCTHHRPAWPVCLPLL